MRTLVDKNRLKQDSNKLVVDAKKDLASVAPHNMNSETFNFLIPETRSVTPVTRRVWGDFSDRGLYLGVPPDGWAWEIVVDTDTATGNPAQMLVLVRKK